MAFALEETVSLDEASIDMTTYDIRKEEANFGNEDFKADHTVPPGWTYKGVIASGRHFHLKCPLGNIYRSRADAFSKMYSSGKYSREEVEMIKESLKYEGWEENETIPKGWRIKRDKHYSIYLFEQGGKKFKSALKALRFVKTYSKYYSEEDLEKLKILTMGSGKLKIADGNSDSSSSWLTDASLYPQKSVTPDSSWLSDAFLYPEGWKYKLCKNSKNIQSRTVIQFLSPEGVNIRGIIPAMSYMIKNGSSTEDITMMRKALSQRGWEQDASLPENWMFRRRHRSLEFCDSLGNHFTSKEKAVEITSKSNVFCEQDLLKIRNFQSKSNNSLNATNLHSDSQTESKRSRFMNWQTDETLHPSGWNFAQTTKLLYFRSPEGRVFKGARVALKNMLENGFSNQDILKMKKAMGLKGWTEHDSLPENWMYRRKGRAIQFCDFKMDFYPSKEVALKKLEGSSDLLVLKEFQAPASTYLKPQRIEKSVTSKGRCRKRFRKSNIPDSSWLSDGSLYPEGWKYRMCKNPTNFEKRTNIQFLLPNGKVLYGLRLALAYMIKNSFSPENIFTIKKALGQRGWKEDASLPENWMYRYMDRLQFCDSFGNYFTSREKALKFVFESSSLSEENILKIKNFQPK